MPHFGQLSGRSDATSGCIGQTYAPAAGTAGPSVAPGASAEASRARSSWEGSATAISGARALAGCSGPSGANVPPAVAQAEAEMEKRNGMRDRERVMVGPRGVAAHARTRDRARRASTLDSG